MNVLTPDGRQVVVPDADVSSMISQYGGAILDGGTLPQFEMNDGTIVEASANDAPQLIKSGARLLATQSMRLNDPNGVMRTVPLENISKAAMAGFTLAQQPRAAAQQEATPDTEQPGVIGEKTWKTAFQEVGQNITSFLPFLNITDMFKDREIYKITKRQAAGEPLTSYEQNTLEAWQANQARDKSWGYKVASTALRMPAFMGEFILSGAAIEGVAKLGLKRAVGKGVITTIDDMAAPATKAILDHAETAFGASREAMETYAKTRLGRAAGMKVGLNEIIDAGLVQGKNATKYVTKDAVGAVARNGYEINKAIGNIYATAKIPGATSTTELAQWFLRDNSTELDEAAKLWSSAFWAGAETEASKAAGKKAIEASGRMLARAAAEATIPRAIMQAHRIADTTYQNRIQNVIMKEDDDFLPAFLKAYGDNVIENFSEQTGENMVFLKGMFGKDSKIMLKAAILSDAIPKIAKKKFNGVSELAVKYLLGDNGFLQRTGWNGLIGEMAEEAVGGVLRMGTGIIEPGLPSLSDVSAMAVGFALNPLAGISLVQGARNQNYKDTLAALTKAAEKARASGKVATSEEEIAPVVENLSKAVDALKPGTVVDAEGKQINPATKGIMNFFDGFGKWLTMSKAANKDIVAYADSVSEGRVTAALKSHEKISKDQLKRIALGLIQRRTIAETPEDLRDLNMLDTEAPITFGDQSIKADYEVAYLGKIGDKLPPERVVELTQKYPEFFHAGIVSVDDAGIELASTGKVIEDSEGVNEYLALKNPAAPSTADLTNVAGNLGINAPLTVERESAAKIIQDMNTLTSQGFRIHTMTDALIAHPVDEVSGIGYTVFKNASQFTGQELMDTGKVRGMQLDPAKKYVLLHRPGASSGTGEIYATMTQKYQHSSLIEESVESHLKKMFSMNPRIREEAVIGLRQQLDRVNFMLKDDKIPERQRAALEIIAETLSAQAAAKDDRPLIEAFSQFSVGVMGFAQPNLVQKEGGSGAPYYEKTAFTGTQAQQLWREAGLTDEVPAGYAAIYQLPESMALLDRLAARDRAPSKRKIFGEESEAYQSVLKNSGKRYGVEVSMVDGAPVFTPDAAALAKIPSSEDAARHIAGVAKQLYPKKDTAKAQSDYVAKFNAAKAAEFAKEVANVIIPTAETATAKSVAQYEKELEALQDAPGFNEEEFVKLPSVESIKALVKEEEPATVAVEEEPEAPVEPLPVPKATTVEDAKDSLTSSGFEVLPYKEGLAIDLSVINKAAGSLLGLPEEKPVAEALKALADSVPGKVKAHIAETVEKTVPVDLLGDALDGVLSYYATSSLVAESVDAQGTVKLGFAGELSAKAEKLFANKTWSLEKALQESKFTKSAIAVLKKYWPTESVTLRDGIAKVLSAVVPALSVTQNVSSVLPDEFVLGGGAVVYKKLPNGTWQTYDSEGSPWPTTTSEAEARTRYTEEYGGLNDADVYERLSVNRRQGTYGEYFIKLPFAVPGQHGEFNDPNLAGWFRTRAMPDGSLDVQEVQSELFQKNKSGFVVGEQEGEIEQDGPYAGSSWVAQFTDEQADFLNLMVNDQVWVPVFVNAITKWAKEQGFKTVRFPTGETAAKVEGHQVLADRLTRLTEERAAWASALVDPLDSATGEVALKAVGRTAVAKMEDIRDVVRMERDRLEEQWRDSQSLQWNLTPKKPVFTQEQRDAYSAFAVKYGLGKNYLAGEDALATVAKPYVRTGYVQLSPLEQTRPDREGTIPQVRRDPIKAVGELQRLDAEIQNLKTQGIEKLAPIEAFYQNRVDSIVRKMGAQPFTDANGNAWQEIRLDSQATSSLEIAPVAMMRDEAIVKGNAPGVVNAVMSRINRLLSPADQPEEYDERDGVQYSVTDWAPVDLSRSGILAMLSTALMLRNDKGLQGSAAQIARKANRAEAILRRTFRRTMVDLSPSQLNELSDMAGVSVNTLKEAKIPVLYNQATLKAWAKLAPAWELNRPTLDEADEADLVFKAGHIELTAENRQERTDEMLKDRMAVARKLGQYAAMVPVDQLQKTVQALMYEYPEAAIAIKDGNSYIQNRSVDGNAIRERITNHFLNVRLVSKPDSRAPESNASTTGRSLMLRYELAWTSADLKSDEAKEFIMYSRLPKALVDERYAQFDMDVKNGPLLTQLLSSNVAEQRAAGQAALQSLIEDLVRLPKAAIKEQMRRIQFGNGVAKGSPVDKLLKSLDFLASFTRNDDGSNKTRKTNAGVEVVNTTGLAGMVNANNMPLITQFKQKLARDVADFTVNAIRQAPAHETQLEHRYKSTSGASRQGVRNGDYASEVLTQYLKELGPEYSLASIVSSDTDDVSKLTADEVFKLMQDMWQNEGNIFVPILSGDHRFVRGILYRAPSRDVDYEKVFNTLFHEMHRRMFGKEYPAGQERATLYDNMAAALKRSSQMVSSGLPAILVEDGAASTVYFVEMDTEENGSDYADGAMHGLPGQLAKLSRSFGHSIRDMSHAIKFVVAGQNEDIKQHTTSISKGRRDENPFYEMLASKLEELSSQLPPNTVVLAGSPGAFKTRNPNMLRIKRDGTYVLPSGQVIEPDQALKHLHAVPLGQLRFLSNQDHTGNVQAIRELIDQALAQPGLMPEQMVSIEDMRDTADDAFALRNALEGMFKGVTFSYKAPVYLHSAPALTQQVQNIDGLVDPDHKNAAVTRDAIEANVAMVRPRSLAQFLSDNVADLLPDNEQANAIRTLIKSVKQTFGEDLTQELINVVKAYTDEAPDEVRDVMSRIDVIAQDPAFYKALSSVADNPQEYERLLSGMYRDPFDLPGQLQRMNAVIQKATRFMRPSVLTVAVPAHRYGDDLLFDTAMEHLWNGEAGWVTNHQFHPMGTQYAIASGDYGPSGQIRYARVVKRVDIIGSLDETVSAFIKADPVLFGDLINADGSVRLHEIMTRNTTNDTVDMFIPGSVVDTNRVPGTAGSHFLVRLGYRPRGTTGELAMHPELMHRSGSDFDVDKWHTYPYLATKIESNDTRIFNQRFVKNLLELYDSPQGQEFLKQAIDLKGFKEALLMPTEIENAGNKYKNMKPAEFFTLENWLEATKDTRDPRDVLGAAVASLGGTKSLADNGNLYIDFSVMVRDNTSIMQYLPGYSVQKPSLRSNYYAAEVLHNQNNQILDNTKDPLIAKLGLTKSNVSLITALMFAQQHNSKAEALQRLKLLLDFFNNTPEGQFYIETVTQRSSKVPSVLEIRREKEVNPARMADIISGKKTKETRTWWKAVPAVGQIIEFSDVKGNAQQVKVTKINSNLRQLLYQNKNNWNAIAAGEGWSGSEMYNRYTSQSNEYVVPESVQIEFERIGEPYHLEGSAVTKFLKELAKDMFVQNDAMVRLRNDAVNFGDIVSLQEWFTGEMTADRPSPLFEANESLFHVMKREVYDKVPSLLSRTALQLAGWRPDNMVVGRIAGTMAYHGMMQNPPGIRALGEKFNKGTVLQARLANEIYGMKVQPAFARHLLFTGVGGNNVGFQSKYQGEEVLPETIAAAHQEFYEMTPDQQKIVAQYTLATWLPAYTPGSLLELIPPAALAGYTTEWINKTANLWKGSSGSFFNPKFIGYKDTGRIGNSEIPTMLNVDGSVSASKIENLSRGPEVTKPEWIAIPLTINKKSGEINTLSFLNEHDDEKLHTALSSSMIAAAKNGIPSIKVEVARLIAGTPVREFGPPLRPSEKGARGVLYLGNGAPKYLGDVAATYKVPVLELPPSMDSAEQLNAFLNAVQENAGEAPMNIVLVNADGEQLDPVTMQDRKTAYAKLWNAAKELPSSRWRVDGFSRVIGQGSAEAMLEASMPIAKAVAFVGQTTVWIPALNEKGYTVFERTDKLIADAKPTEHAPYLSRGLIDATKPQVTMPDRFTSTSKDGQPVSVYRDPTVGWMAQLDQVAMPITDEQALAYYRRGAAVTPQQSAPIAEQQSAQVDPDNTFNPTTFAEAQAVLESRETILSQSEARILAEKLGIKSGEPLPRILTASERTDPVWYAKHVKELVASKRFDALYIITKHDGLAIRELLQLPIPKMIHFSITTLGDTEWEPGVMKWRDLMERIEDFVKQGLDPNMVTIRIDPIVPGVTNMSEVKQLMQRSVAAGIKRVRFSIMDGYSGEIETKIRSLYGDKIDKFYVRNGSRMDAKQSVVDILAKEFLSIAEAVGIEEVGSCAEKISSGIGVKKEGCLPVSAVKEMLDLSEIDESKSKQRPLCLCFGGKVDGFKYDNTCPSSCVYCYAKHGNDKSAKYYDENGNLKTTRATLTRPTGDTSESSGVLTSSLDVSGAQATSALDNPVIANLSRSLQRFGFITEDMPIDEKYSLQMLAEKIMASPENELQYIQQAAKALSYLSYPMLFRRDGKTLAREALENILSFVLYKKYKEAGGKESLPTFDLVWAEAKDAARRLGAWYSENQPRIKALVDNTLSGNLHLYIGSAEGTPAGLEKISVQNLINESEVAQKILNELASSGVDYILTGSVAYTNQITMYRKPGYGLHDLDVLVDKKDAPLLSRRLKNTFLGSRELYNLKGHGRRSTDTLGIVIPPSGYTISDVSHEIRPSAGVLFTRGYRVRDSKNKIVGTYDLSKAQTGEVTEIATGIKATVVDLISNTEARSSVPTSIALPTIGKTVVVPMSLASSGMAAKLDMLRLKDIKDWAFSRRVEATATSSLDVSGAQALSRERYTQTYQASKELAERFKGVVGRLDQMLKAERYEEALALLDKTNFGGFLDFKKRLQGVVSRARPAPVKRSSPLWYEEEEQREIGYRFGDATGSYIPVMRDYVDPLSNIPRWNSSPSLNYDGQRALFELTGRQKVKTMAFVQSYMAQLAELDTRLGSKTDRLYQYDPKDGRRQTVNAMKRLWDSVVHKKETAFLENGQVEWTAEDQNFMDEVRTSLGLMLDQIQDGADQKKWDDIAAKGVVIQERDIRGQAIVSLRDKGIMSPSAQEILQEANGIVADMSDKSNFDFKIEEKPSGITLKVIATPAKVFEAYAASATKKKLVDAGRAPEELEPQQLVTEFRSLFDSAPADIEELGKEMPYSKKMAFRSHYFQHVYHAIGVMSKAEEKEFEAKLKMIHDSGAVLKLDEKQYLEIPKSVFDKSMDLWPDATEFQKQLIARLQRETHAPIGFDGNIVKANKELMRLYYRFFAMRSYDQLKESDKARFNFIAAQDKELLSNKPQYRIDSGRFKHAVYATFGEAYEKAGLLPKNLDPIEVLRQYVREVFNTAANKNAVMLAATSNSPIDGFPLVVFMPAEGGEAQASIFMPDQYYEAMARSLARSMQKEYNEKLSGIENLKTMATGMAANKDYVSIPVPMYPFFSALYARKGDGWMGHGANAVAAMKNLFGKPASRPWPNFMQNLFANIGRVMGVDPDRQALATRDMLKDFMVLTQLMKFNNLAFSPFFGFSAIESFVASEGVKETVRGTRDFKNSIAYYKEVRKQLLNGEFDPRHKRLIANGYTGDAKYDKFDIEMGHPQNMSKWFKEHGGKLGKVAAFLVDRQIAFTEFQFGDLFPVFKYVSSMHMLDEIQNIKDKMGLGELTDEDYHQVAIAMNDGFGGQNWRDFWWATPGTMQAMNLLLFAPNWGISSFRIAGGSILMDKMGIGPEVTQTQIDFMKKTWISMVSLVLMAWPNFLQSMIYGLFGDPDKDKAFTFLNEKGKRMHIDITPLMRKLPWYKGDPSGERREYVRWGKQAYEVYDTKNSWMADVFNLRFDTLQRKLSAPVRLAIELATGKTAGSDWSMDYKDMGLLGIIAGEKEGFAGSRMASILSSVLPYSISGLSTSSEGLPFSWFGSVSKGTSQFDLEQELTRVLRTYADDATYAELEKNGAAQHRLRGLATNVIEAALANGYDPKAVITSARGAVLKNLYLDILKALDENDESAMKKIAPRILRVNGTLDGVIQSLKTRNRRYMTPVELTPEQTTLLEGVFQP